MSVPDESFMKYGLDLVGPLKETERGNKYIIVLTDYLTKFPEAKPIPSKEAIHVKEFITEIICRYSVPSSIITDQGREFCNELNDQLCNYLGIKHRVTSAYNPQANGLTERFNRTLVESLVKYVNGREDDWDLHIQPILFAYRSAPQKSTKKSPYSLVFGKEPRLPIEFALPVETGYEDGMGAELSLAKRVEAIVPIFAMQAKAKQNILCAQQQQKKYFDARHTGPSYKIGDQVLVKNMRRLQRCGGKLEPRWSGPFTITEIVKSGSMRVTGKKCLFACSRVKPYKMPTGTSSGRLETVVAKIKDTAHNSEMSGIEDSDFHVIDETSAPEVLFCPPTMEWQRMVAKAVAGSDVSVLRLLDMTKKVFANDYIPTLRKSVVGDGNCWYRAVSYLVFGDESRYADIRVQVSRFMEVNAAKLNERNGENYVENSQVAIDQVWATDAEISATSTMLRTKIYLHAENGGKWRWLKFDPLPNMKPLLRLPLQQRACT